MPNLITLSPSSIAFSHTTTPTRIVTISQSTYAGPYTATSSNTAVVTVAISGANALLTPAGSGSATITISDGSGDSQTLAVTVGGVAGQVLVSMSSITLATASVPATFTASRSGDNGAFTVAVTPTGIISVSGSGNAPGPITYHVTPIKSGTATVSISATDGATTSLSVTVTGALTAAVASSALAMPIEVAVSEVGYLGVFTPSFIGSTSATIFPSTGFGPNQVFTITDAAPNQTIVVKFTDSLGGSKQLTLKTPNSSLGPVLFTFYDETGINPVAPGSQYQIYAQGDVQVPANLVTSGFLGVGGQANLTLDQLTAYAIVWIGQQAPTVITTFTTGAVGIVVQSVTVTPYRSPNLSTLGYAAAQLAQWTGRWVGDQYKQPGTPGTTGLAYDIAYSFAALLGQGGATLFQGQELEVLGLDTYLQNINVATRLFNCSGNQLDTFFADFLGQSFKRQTGELDAAFLARGIIALNNEVATRKALNDATNAAWQSLGESGTIVCDDVTSNPTLLSQLGYTEPYFVVLLPTITNISDAFFLNERYLGINTYLLDLGTAILLNLSQVPPLVQQAVESKRALGTIPLYAQYIN